MKTKQQISDLIQAFKLKIKELQQSNPTFDSLTKDRSTKIQKTKEDEKNPTKLRKKK